VSPEQPILILVGPTKNKKNVLGATKNTKISILGWKIYFWLLLKIFWLHYISFWLGHPKLKLLPLETLSL
jgi:hypothetical protein